MAYAAVAEVDRLAERDGLPATFVEPVRAEFARPLAVPDAVTGSAPRPPMTCGARCGLPAFARHGAGWSSCTAPTRLMTRCCKALLASSTSRSCGQGASTTD